MFQVSDISLQLEGHVRGKPGLLHGRRDSSYLGGNQIPFLVLNGFRATTPDQRGFGRSDRPEEVARYSLQNVELLPYEPRAQLAEVASQAAACRDSDIRYLVLTRSLPRLRRSEVVGTLCEGNLALRADRRRLPLDSSRRARPAEPVPP
jgi:hypothetical protein